MKALPIAGGELRNQVNLAHLVFTSSYYWFLIDKYDSIVWIYSSPFLPAALPSTVSVTMVNGRPEAGDSPSEVSSEGQW